MAIKDYLLTTRERAFHVRCDLEDPRTFAVAGAVRVVYQRNARRWMTTQGVEELALTGPGEGAEQYMSVPVEDHEDGILVWEVRLLRPMRPEAVKRWTSL